jgi:hypothetical protein
MLISKLIKQLEDIKKENGDLPVYFTDGWHNIPVLGAWTDDLHRDEEDELVVGVYNPLIAIIG